jgi:hypothetical protein
LFGIVASAALKIVFEMSVVILSVFVEQNGFPIS